MSLKKICLSGRKPRKTCCRKPLVDFTVLMAALTSAVNRPEQRIAEGQPLWWDQNIFDHKYTQEGVKPHRRPYSGGRPGRQCMSMAACYSKCSPSFQVEPALPSGFLHTSPVDFIPYTTSPLSPLSIFFPPHKHKHTARPQNNPQSPPLCISTTCYGHIPMASNHSLSVYWKMTIHQGFVSKMRLLVIAAVIAQTIRHILWFEMLLFTKEKILGLKGTPERPHLDPTALLPCLSGTSHSCRSQITHSPDWGLGRTVSVLRSKGWIGGG